VFTVARANVKRVFSSQDALVVGNIRNLLLNEGIESEVKTPFLAAALGDIPVLECWSEVWITNDEDSERAAAVISAALGPSGEASALWKCSKCGEEIEGQFEACWQCGSARVDGDA
jgi:anaerobic ribonucleoside-triphosphate reductase